MKKYWLLAVFILVGMVAFSGPLTSNTIKSCMEQVEAFVDKNDYDNFYSLHIEIISLGGRAYDSNQIITKNSDGRLYIQIWYENTVYIRIFVTKSPERYDGGDYNFGINFFSRDDGYCTTHNKTFEKGYQYDILYTMRRLFRSFGL